MDERDPLRRLSAALDAIDNVRDVLHAHVREAQRVRKKWDPQAERLDTTDALAQLPTRGRLQELVASLQHETRTGLIALILLGRERGGDPEVSVDAARDALTRAEAMGPLEVRVNLEAVEIGRHLDRGVEVLRAITRGRL